MGSFMDDTELSKTLTDAGNKLLKPISSTDATLTLLDETASLLSTIEQDPIESVQRALVLSVKALVSPDLLRNPDSDVRLLVVSCLTDLMRITAPVAPYNDDQMKEIFEVTIEAFGKLADASCPSYKKAEDLLHTFSKVKLSLVMLDLECDDLVLEMLRQLLKIIRPDHPQQVILSIETVMTTVIDEIEEVTIDLLEILLTAVKKESQDVAPTSSELVERVLRSCANRLQPCLLKALNFKGTSLDMFSSVVLSICQTETAPTQAHNVEADEKISEKQVPSSSLEDNHGEALKKSSGNKTHGEEVGGSSLAAEKASLPKPIGKGKRGSRKRKLIKMDETSNDVDSIASPRIVKKGESEEEDLMVSDDKKAKERAKSEKEKAVKTSSKKPVSETKKAKNSGKKPDKKSDAKKKNSETASVDTPSKSKVGVQKDTTSSTKKNKKNPKSNSNKRKRTSSGEEMESDTNDEHGEELVGKKVNIWWPMDRTFYEGVIDSYSSSKKTHLVSYCDGEAEELNLENERFEIIQEDEEVDLLESVPLCDFIQKQKAKKSKIRTSLKELSSETGRTKGRTAKKQKVAQATHQESEEKEDQDKNTETDGEEEQKGPKTDEGEHAIAMETDAEPEADDEREQSPLKETIVDPKTDDQEHKVAEESALESKTVEEEQAKDTNAEPKSDEKEQEPLGETDEEPKREGEEETAATKLVEEDNSEAKREETDKETDTSMTETGKVENEAEDVDERDTKELKDGITTGSG